MTRGDYTEVVLKKGVLSFDGRVVELFGYGNQETQRWHVTQIEAIGVTIAKMFGSVLQVELSDGPSYSCNLKLEESDQPAVKDLLDRVRTAAPNLKESA
jgi:hypothetical protein